MSTAAAATTPPPASSSAATTPSPTTPPANKPSQTAPKPSPATRLVTPSGVQTSSSSNEILTDPHTDVVATFASGATSLNGAAGYNPLGQPLATRTLTSNLGYQSSWTDPATGKISMQARFYNPTTGTFISRDTYDVPNRYNSANAN